MTEKYLHFIWKNKRIPPIDIQLFDQQLITVIDFGEYNKNNCGPDFTNGCIDIDGVKLHGHIEMHVMSSDWYKHKHQFDSNFNNVILHVVYENDIDIVQDGVKLQVLELKSHIDENHYKHYLKKQMVFLI